MHAISLSWSKYILKSKPTLINNLSDKHKRAFMDRYEKALEPFTKARGIDWEVQITDADVRNFIYSYLF